MIIILLLSLSLLLLYQNIIWLLYCHYHYYMIVTIIIMLLLLLLLCIVCYYVVILLINCVCTVELNIRHNSQPITLTLCHVPTKHCWRIVEGIDGFWPPCCQSFPVSGTFLSLGSAFLIDFVAGDIYAVYNMRDFIWPSNLDYGYGRAGSNLWPTPLNRVYINHSTCWKRFIMSMRPCRLSPRFIYLLIFFFFFHNFWLFLSFSFLGAGLLGGFQVFKSRQKNESWADSTQSRQLVDEFDAILVEFNFTLKWETGD